MQFGQKRRSIHLRVHFQTPSPELSTLNGVRYRVGGQPFLQVGVRYILFLRSWSSDEESQSLGFVAIPENERERAA